MTTNETFYIDLRGGEGRERKRERKRNTDWLPIICALTRDQIHKLGMCPSQEPNP